MTEIAKEETICEKLALVLNKLYYGGQKRDKKTQISATVKSILEWCNEPERHRVYSI